MNKQTYLQRYAAAGFKLFPVHSVENGICTCKDGRACQNPGKHPRVSEWQKKATSDMKQIDAWWKRWPEANIGIATGEGSGLAVVDVDDLRDLESLEMLYDDLPRMVTTRTGSGGMHIFMKHPGGGRKIKSQAGVIDGFRIDARGEGGYIIAPPSVNAKGSYTEASGILGETELPEIPDEWLPLLLDQGCRPSGRRERSGLTVPEMISEGSRNDTLFKFACSLREKGCGEETIKASVEALNLEQCDPPLDDDEVHTLVKSALQYKPGPLPGTWKPGTYPFRLTDLGNSEMLSTRLIGSFVWVPERKQWFYFNGMHWEADTCGALTQRAKVLIRDAQYQALSIHDERLRGDVLKQLTKLEDAARLKAALELLKDNAGMTRSIAGFDRDTMLLNVTNGTIDLRKGKLRDHRPEDYITKCCPVKYDPESRSEIWERFLEEIFLGDQYQITYMQKLFGYALTGRTTEEEMYFFRGSGANGKTKLVEAIKYVMGPYCVPARTELLLAKDVNAIPNDIADLKGARLAIMSEPDAGKRLSESTVKSLTGGDTIKARKLYCDLFEFQMQAKLIMLSNHDLRAIGTDHGLWRRIAYIPFNYTVPADKQDKELQSKLENAASAILAWAVQGCLLWQKTGLQHTEKMKQAKEGYKQSQDAVRLFLEECCEEDETAKITKTDLYQNFKTWCLENGEYVITKRAFGQRLQEKGFEEKRDGAARWWKGIRLNADNLGILGGDA